MLVKIGERLNQLRKNLELSQEKLAEMLGTTRQSVLSWENGQQIIPSKLLIKLCDIYNVSADYILCRQDEVQSSLYNDIKADFVAKLVNAGFENSQQYFRECIEMLISHIKDIPNPDVLDDSNSRPLFDNHENQQTEPSNEPARELTAEEALALVDDSTLFRAVPVRAYNSKLSALQRMLAASDVKIAFDLLTSEPRGTSQEENFAAPANNSHKGETREIGLQSYGVAVNI